MRHSAKYGSLPVISSGASVPPSDGPRATCMSSNTRRGTPFSHISTRLLGEMSLQVPDSVQEQCLAGQQANEYTVLHVDERE